MLYISTIHSTNFNILIVAMGDVITEIKFGTLRANDLPENATTIECKRQLEEYFNGTRKEFDVEYWYHGTEFQEKVWKAISTIPYGETITYKQLAEKIGAPNAVRAVGNACNSNMLAILLPCHRVVNSNGTLSSYQAGPEIKKMLLDLEKRG
ncbi:MAG: methylated-DNA--[Phascolarctobacterium sp.]|nr:methylated-DNA--[protein]-cysteine S-methyltransferase [Phascolarctobacterium sp.]